jgi:hypothetical protein
MFGFEHISFEGIFLNIQKEISTVPLDIQLQILEKE